MFKKLYEKEKSLKEHEISENIISVVREITPLLERIPENMPEFTLHNANHSVRVVELMGKIVPSETLKKLNIIELSILIYAAYLHDIGMTASRDEREEVIKSDPEYAKLLVFNEELSLKLEEAKKSGDHRTATFIEDKLFTEFLRKTHVERSHKLIKEKYGSEETPIKWKGTPYYKSVQSVCDSHGLPVRDLYDTRRWRRDSLVRDQSVNVQYLSVILRLADILDLDPERTPKCLLDFINPKDETSIREWKKHLSIIGCKISQEEISIEAECEHPIYERALREFIDLIETERKESILLTSRYKDDLAEKYRLDLLKPVTKENIRSNEEYIYSDFHFKLDFHGVIDLLMGERLYGDPTLTLRELLQNSVDAVRYRESMEKKEGNPFSSFIKITLKNDELIIEDNGIGMDNDIFENYFLQIGRSYYNSSECRTSGVEIDPVSEFGIGILSIFMVASNFRVESRRKPLDPLHPPDPINVEIPTAYDYFVRRPSSHVEIGTKITLALKSNHPFSSISLIEKISEIAPFIEYPIVIETSEKIVTYKPYLPGEKIHNVKDTKEYFEISFDDEIKGIEGKLRIFGSIDNSNIIFGKSEYSVFAQNGFSIPCDKLLPENLFFNIQASINISGQSKLSLSPNRLDIVKDEKYEKLINVIQSGIMLAYEKYLKTLKDSSPISEYVEIINTLLGVNILSFPDKHRMGGFVYQEKEVRKFIESIFLNYAPLLTISEDGQRTYKVMKDLNIADFAIVGINDWAEQISDAIILKETKRLVGEETVILMDEEKGSFPRYYFLDKILENFSDIYITSIPGVVIKVFSNQINEGIFSLNYKTFTYRMHNHSKEKAPLFVHPPDINWQEDPNEFLEVIYNAGHPLFARLLNYDKPKNENSSKAIESLIYQIENCLNHLLDKLYSSTLKRIRGFETSENVNYMLIGILKHQPQIFNEFCEAIEEYWEDAKDMGVVSCDEGFIGFSIDDLPWFWNCELSDFKFE